MRRDCAVAYHTVPNLEPGGRWLPHPRCDKYGSGGDRVLLLAVHGRSDAAHGGGGRTIRVGHDRGRRHPRQRHGPLGRGHARRRAHETAEGRGVCHESRDSPPGGDGGRHRVARPALPRSAALAEGVTVIKQLLTGQPADYRGGTAHLPWVTHAPRVFQAASVPTSLAAAGAAADGVFINYGLDAVSLRVSAGHVARGAESVGRPADDLEVWQIACLDCHLERDVARRTLGAILAFVSSYVIGGGDDLAARGVPAPFVEPLRELRRRYSTRPGDADARLVEELGLFEYLARRLALWGDPEDCLRQALGAKAAGVKRLMLTGSLAADPVGTVELFGAQVLPALRRVDDARPK